MTDTIINIAILSPLINIVIGLSIFRSLAKEMKLFVSYQIAIFIVDVVMAVFAEYRLNNLLLIHLYFFLQFVMLSAFYFRLLKAPSQRRLVGILSVFAAILEGVNLLFFTDDLFEFSNFEIFICSFPPIIYAALHFYNMLEGEKQYHYISAGIMAYLFGSTVIFLSGNLLNELHLKDDYVRITNSTMYIGYQILVFLNLRKIISENRKIEEVA